MQQDDTYEGLKMLKTEMKIQRGGGESRTWEPNLVTGALGRRKELEG